MCMGVMEERCDIFSRGEVRLGLQDVCMGVMWHGCYGREM